MIELVGLGGCTCYDEELKRRTRLTQKLISPRRGHGLSSLGVAGAASALTLTAQVLHISPWGKSLDHISTWGKSTTTFPGGKSPPHVPLGENPRPHFQGKVSTTFAPRGKASNTFPGKSLNHMFTGMEIIRRHVADYISERDGSPADWRNVMLCAGYIFAQRNIDLQVIFCLPDWLKRASVSFYQRKYLQEPARVFAPL